MLFEKIMSFLVSQAVCIPFIRKPFQDLRHPQRSFGLNNAMNVRIRVSSSEEVGAWFLQPNAIDITNLPRNSEEQFDPNVVNPDIPLVGEDQVVVMYLHGNAETRAQYHRLELYKIWQRMGYHVLAIDYRGYGDSSKVTPKETTMVEDAKAAFLWLSSVSSPSSKIFIWGHSLGTGVTSKLANDLILDESGRKFSGLILEAPFNRMSDEVKSFALSKILPMIGLDIDRVLKTADVSFDSTKWLKTVTDRPILILHAEDDR